MLEKVKLEKVEAKKWYKNALIFLSPVVVIYLTQIIGFIQQDNGAFSVNVLVPTQFSLGAMVLYVANSLIDYLRKLQSQ